MTFVLALQGQSLINFCGDVVQVSYDAADTHTVTLNLGGVSPVLKTIMTSKFSPIGEQRQQQQQQAALLLSAHA
jgi:hypothetical protein